MGGWTMVDHAFLHVNGGVPGCTVRSVHPVYGGVYRGVRPFGTDVHPTPPGTHTTPRGAHTSKTYRDEANRNEGHALHTRHAFGDVG